MINRLDFLIGIGAATTVGATVSPCRAFKNSNAAAWNRWERAVRSKLIDREAFLSLDAPSAKCLTLYSGSKKWTYKIGDYEPEQAAKTLARLINRDGAFVATTRGAIVTLTQNL